MMFVISLLLFLSFSVSAILLGFGPNSYRVSYNDFWQDGYENAELEGLRRGQLLQRADPSTMIPPATFTGTIARTVVATSDGGQENLVTNYFAYTYTAATNTAVTITAISAVTVKQ